MEFNQRLRRSISEDQSELKLSLESPSKVTKALNLHSFQGSLVNRKCYQDLRNIIERNVVAGNEMNFSALGSPGLGKPYFLLYMLIHLSTKTHTAVFLNTLRGHRYVVFPGNDEVFKFRTFDDCEDALTLPASENGVFYQLYDAGTKGGKSDPIVPDPDLVTIVASSPDKSNYREFAKDKPQELYMEPRSYGELKLANRLLSTPLDERVLRKRHALAGGIPR